MLISAVYKACNLKGKCHVLTSFVKNGEIRPSLSYKIFLEQREERNQLQQFLKGTTRDLFWCILGKICENLKNFSLTFFKFQSIPACSVSDQRHKSTVLLQGGGGGGEGVIYNKTRQLFVDRQTFLGFEMT